MTLQLQYYGETTIPVEVEGILPEKLRELSLAEIEQLPIHHGNTQCPLAEFFRVSGDASDEVICWQGELSGVHWLGAQMRSGSMRVEGNIGRHVGSEMRGGQIEVRGNASDWVGAEMHGGRIHIRGNAGHLVGSAYRGSSRGMTAGTILVDGDAGNEIGHTLRRGVVAVGGKAGDLAGFNMLAGSVLLFGETGIRHGAGMHRGTLGFFGSSPPPILSSFRFACRFRPDVLKLFARQLRQLGFAPADSLRDMTIDLYNGDMIEGGRGEMLIRAEDT